MNYTLKYRDLIATVASLGAELTSLQRHGKEYIWTGDTDYWNGHNPILFPVIGFLKNGKTVFDGVEYEIPKHGYARKSEFSLVSHTENSITLEMTDTEETRKGFPFRFGFQVTHTLTEDGFVTAYRVENRDERRMPFMIGAHTGFLLPFSDGAKFEDHTLLFEHPECDVTRYVAVGGQIIENPDGQKNYLDGADRLPLSYSLFEDDALMLSGLCSRKIALLDQNGHGVGMEFEGFDAFGIWTPPGKNAPFLCLEPWNGINAFRNEEAEFSKKPFIRSTEPGECYTVSYRVRIID
ncbi:MAG: aldose 1-epimerase family protein [Clostridia bacterium]|nr:aldose 1-epimerase family protein [Clostridia bacterium]